MNELNKMKNEKQIEMLQDLSPSHLTSLDAARAERLSLLVTRSALRNLERVTVLHATRHT